MDPRTHYRIGTSGWRYPHWRGDFYPAELSRSDELPFAAARFTALELNGTFYALQRPSSYHRWHDNTPADFVFAVKGSRFITHLRGLVDVETALANFFASGVLALGGKLGPILWQLSDRTAFDPRLLETFLAGLPRTMRAAAALGSRHDDRVRGDRVDLGGVHGPTGAARP